MRLFAGTLYILEYHHVPQRFIQPTSPTSDSVAASGTESSARAAVQARTRSECTAVREGRPSKASLAGWGSLLDRQDAEPRVDLGVAYVAAPRDLALARHW